jgi:hypothetical protein
MTKKTDDRKKDDDDKLERVHVRPDAADLETPFDDEHEGDGRVFIECPGATIYDPETREIVSGVKFIDDNDPSLGYEIIDKQVFAPNHRRRRLIKKEHVGLIRRCQACQDLTVRMIRSEGADFCVPNPRFPHRKRLKSVEKNW